MVQVGGFSSFFFIQTGMALMFWISSSDTQIEHSTSFSGCGFFETTT